MRVRKLRPRSCESYASCYHSWPPPQSNSYRIRKELGEHLLIKSGRDIVREGITEKIVELVPRQAVRTIGIILDHHSLQLNKALDHNILIGFALEKAADVSFL